MALRMFYLLLLITFSSIGTLAEEETGEEQADAASVTPKFTSQIGEHTVGVGNTATLPCRVADIAESDATVAWYRVGATAENDNNENPEESGEQLFLDRQRIIDDHRFQLAEGGDSVYDLNIAEVTAYDSGPYECRISTTPPLVQQQTLKVLVPPRVNLMPESSPYTVEIGQLITLNCDASGFPQPEVVWTREGGPLPDGRASHKGKGQARLVYDSANASHAGVYRCSADNGVGDSVSVSITVDVVSKEATNNAPMVHTEHKFVPVNDGQNVSISCNYSGNPAPRIHWYYNNFPMNQHSDKYKDRINITAQAKPGEDTVISTLTVANIQESDFGEYICRVANNLGEKEAVIVVSGKPGPPYGFTAAIYGDRIDLTWHLESAPDIKGYKLFYRKPNEDFSLSIEVPAEAGRRVKGNEWRAHYSWYYNSKSTPMLKPDTEYQLSVQGVNVHGEGSLSKPILDVRTPAKFDGVEQSTTEKVTETKDNGNYKANAVKAGSVGGKSSAVSLYRPGRTFSLAVLAPMILAVILRSLA